MSDLILRGAAIDALNKEIYKVTEPMSETFRTLRAGVRLARNIIEDIPPAESLVWIPVNELLPEHNEDVLISCGPCVEAGWYNEIDGTWCTEVCSSLRVTAWMPLPAPYKEAKHGKEES